MRYAFMSAVWIAAVTLGLVAKGEVYRDPKFHFSFQLPPGWQTMPAETLSDINHLLSQRLSQKNPLFDQVFLPVGGELADSPYVLVECIPADLNGLSYEQIQREFDKESQTTVEKVEGALSDLGSDLSMGQAVVDRTRNRVVFTTQLDVAGVGPVRGVTFGFFSSQGIVFLNCYDLASDFQRRAPLFEVMAESFTVDPGYEFQPGSSGLFNTSIPITRIALFAAIGIGSICAGLFRFVMRRAQETQAVGSCAE